MPRSPCVGFDLRGERPTLSDKNQDCALLFPSSHQADPPPRVVITGVGIITALGKGWQANADGFRAGRAAIRPVSLVDGSRQRVRAAGGTAFAPPLRAH